MYKSWVGFIYNVEIHNSHTETWLKIIHSFLDVWSISPLGRGQAYPPRGKETSGHQKRKHFRAKRLWDGICTRAAEVDGSSCTHMIALDFRLQFPEELAHYAG